MKSFIAIILIITFSVSCDSSKKSTTESASGASLKGTYWKLTELAGTAVTAREGVKEVYLKISSTDSTVQGNGGCNGFGGNYTLGNGDRIKFSRMISTMMACDGLDVENSLYRALENTDSYVIKGDTLQLNRARMAPLARFVAVAGK
ncbi:META domain-containing protein [Pollutibacter soli]|uniref:META domain-containing protein n=1 Tax=Pollutibacter soli TaxID=3034157 RepID=UPI0030132C44